jgi:hypothetical protein
MRSRELSPGGGFGEAPSKGGGNGGAHKKCRRKPTENAKTMQIKIFTIPVVADDRDVEELNHFLPIVKMAFQGYKKDWALSMIIIPD